MGTYFIYGIYGVFLDVLSSSSPPELTSSPFLHLAQREIILQLPLGLAVLVLARFEMDSQLVLDRKDGITITKGIRVLGVKDLRRQGSIPICRHNEMDVCRAISVAV